MGRRRKTAKFGVAPKHKEKIPTAFDCPFCAGSETVACFMDREKQVGLVQCDVCHASFTTMINALSEPVDVYCDWIDACEDAN